MLVTDNILKTRNIYLDPATTERIKREDPRTWASFTEAAAAGKFLIVPTTKKAEKALEVAILIKMRTRGDTAYVFAGDNKHLSDRVKRDHSLIFLDDLGYLLRAEPAPSEVEEEVPARVDVNASEVFDERLMAQLARAAAERAVDQALSKKLWNLIGMRANPTRAPRFKVNKITSGYLDAGIEIEFDFEATFSNGILLRNAKGNIRATLQYRAIGDMTSIPAQINKGAMIVISATLADMVAPQENLDSYVEYERYTNEYFAFRSMNP